MVEHMINLNIKTGVLTGLQKFESLISLQLYLFSRVFSKVKSRSAHMKIHRPDQDKEKEKKAKAANRALLAQKPLQIDPLAYEPALPNGPLN